VAPHHRGVLDLDEPFRLRVLQPFEHFVCGDLVIEGRNDDLDWRLIDHFATSFDLGLAPSEPALIRLDALSSRPRDFRAPKPTASVRRARSLAGRTLRGATGQQRGQLEKDLSDFPCAANAQITTTSSTMIRIDHSG